MRARSARSIAAAITVAGMLLSLAGCGNDEGDGDTAKRELRIYGADGIMNNGFGEALKDSPSALAGMKGTTPLTPLSEDFRRRVKQLDPNLLDLNYAGESYDAVVIAALAAEIARTVEPSAIAKQLVGTTTGDGLCETAAACLALAKSGRDVKYRGVSLRRSGLTEAGEPSSAMYGVMNFGRGNTIEDAKTEFVGAGDERTEHNAAPPAVASAGKGPTSVPLKFGLLLSKTGVLTIQSQPAFAGAKLAVKEINDAGGVLGKPVLVEDGDDGTNPDVAKASVQKFIGNGVHVIIGAASSGVTKAVLPQVVAAARVMISPSATSDELTKTDDKGLFFRTSPPDVLQAKALADVIMRDGHTRVAIVARDDSYGIGLSDNVVADLHAAGIKPGDLKVLKYKVKSAYDAKADTEAIFNPVVRDFKAFGATAILLVGFEETSFVIKVLVAEGLKVRS